MGREEACVRFGPAPTRRIPGIGPKTADRLAELGYATVGHLQEADEAQLAALFGGRHGALPEGARARSRTTRRSRPDAGPAKSVLDGADVRRRHRRPRGARAAAARDVGASSAPALPAKRGAGRTIAIKVRLDDWTTVTRARTLEAPTNDAALVTEVAVELLRAYAPPRPCGCSACGWPASRTSSPTGRRRPRAGRPAARRGLPDGSSHRRVGRVSRLVQRGGELAARLARQRVLDAEVVQDADDGARAGPRGGPRRSPRSRRSARPARARSRRRRARRTPRPAPGPGLEAQAGGEAVGGERAGDVARAAPAPPRRSPRSASMRASATAASARPGSSSSARRRPSSSPLGDQRVGLEGSSSSRKRSTCGGGWAPTNSLTTWPSLNALTAGMPWMRNADEMRGLASVSSFASSTWPSRSATAFSSTGPSARHGPHHSAQKSTTTGTSWERSMTSRSKVASVASMITIRG